MGFLPPGRSAAKPVETVVSQPGALLRRAAGRSVESDGSATPSDAASIAPLLPGACGAGRPRRTGLREVEEAIRHLVCTGGAWRMLPRDFSPWQAADWWFRRFVRLTPVATVHELAMMRDRQRAGRGGGAVGGRSKA